MQQIYEDWGRRIRSRRKAMGLTAAQLAAQIGVDPAQISRWENGVRGPSDQQKLDLAGALGVTTFRLFPLRVSE